MEKLPLVVVLNNIRSAYNVGSVLRTSDCAGVEAVFTCGYTPESSHPKVKKTALDAEESVSSRHFQSAAACIKELLDEGYTVYALETGENAQSLWETKFAREKIALVMGNEVTGVESELIQQFNLPLLEIPMFGVKESLNVASAAAIGIYEVARQMRL